MPEYGSFTPGFIKDLSNRLQGKKVLEVYAGNGFLANELRKHNVDITATTIFSGHDGHADGIYTDIVEMSGMEAVTEYGDDADILLVSWPTTTEDFYNISMAWGSEKPIVYIGEMPSITNSDNKLPGKIGFSSTSYASCASDTFFEAIDDFDILDSYEGRNMLDKAAIIHMNPDYVNDWENGNGLKFKW